VGARIQNGVVLILAFFFAFNVQALTEVSEFTSVLLDHLRWINGRELNSNKCNLEVMGKLKSFIKRME
jgi:hypothetical protein